MAKVDLDIGALLARHELQLRSLDVDAAVEGVSRRLSEATPGQADERDLLILALWLRLSELETTVGKLQSTVEKLQGKVGLNSRNSSRPPSSDLPGARKKKDKKRTGRRRGAQKGHEAHHRELVPLEGLAHSEDIRPDTCRRCNKELHGNDPDPYRHQVAELVKPVVSVSEYRLHTLKCDGCRTETTGKLPLGVPTGGFGTRVISTVASLTGRFRASKRLAQEMLSDLFDLQVSLGSITRCEQIASEAVRAAVTEARDFVKSHPVKYADETSWAEGERRDRSWLWAVTVGVVTTFMIHANRNSKAARKLLGEVFGILVTDRWSAYTWWPLSSRQLCWSHLIRDFQSFVDAGGEAAQIGERLLKCKDQLFLWWSQLKDGQLSRRALQRRVAILRREVRTLLRAGVTCSHKKTRGSCKAMLKVEPAFWTFVRVAGVEPTNNGAERVIRPAVIWRKLSFGTHSRWGSRYVERILTVSATIRQQGRNVTDYLHDSVQRYLLHQEPPSLLPEQENPSEVLLAA